MDATEFYDRQELINETPGYLEPPPIKQVGKWGAKSRIQVAYEMLAPYAKFDSFLDIGCGNLSNMLALENLFERGCGVDIAVYPTWEPLGDRFATYQHNLDASPLPFSDRMFDAVTILMVLEHIFDPFMAIEEIARVTKPEGYLAINVPNIAYIKHRLGLLAGQLPVTSSVNRWEMREWDGGHIHYFTLERLVWLLDKFGGYQVLQVQGSGKFGSLKRLWPGLLCSDLQLLCRKKA